MNAEVAYLFRNAVLRDAAYQLQLPARRGFLHGLALEIIEQALGIGPQSDAAGPIAAELADHAAMAAQTVQDKDAQSALLKKEAGYVWKAAQFAERNFDSDAAVRLFDRLAENQHVSVYERGTAYLHAGRLFLYGGKSAECRLRYERGLAWGRKHQLANVEADALCGLGNVVIGLGDLAKAEELYSESLELATRSGSTLYVAVAEGNLAALLSDSGRTEQAMEHFEHARVANRAIGRRDNEARGLMNVAGAWMNAGQPGKALPSLEAALLLASELSHKHIAAMCRANLAECLRQLGRFKEAEAALALAEIEVRNTGDRRFEAVIHACRANLCDDRTDWRGCADSNLAAIAVCRETREVRSEAQAMGNLGAALRELGELGRSKAALEEAIRAFDAQSNSLFAACARCTLAGLQLLLGETARADALLKRALEDMKPAWAAPLRVQFALTLAFRREVAFAQLSGWKAKELAQAEAAMHALEQEAKASATSGNAQGERDTKACRALWAEVEAARKAGRPALVLRGCTLAELPQLLKHALFAFFTKEQPEVLSALEAPVQTALREAAQGKAPAWERTSVL